MSEPIERVDIPCGGSALAAFRAFRVWAEQVAASQGKTLAPAWYEDSPEDRPGLYRKSPAGQQEEGEPDPPGVPHEPEPMREASPRKDH